MESATPKSRPSRGGASRNIVHGDLQPAEVGRPSRGGASRNLNEVPDYGEQLASPLPWGRE